MTPTLCTRSPNVGNFFTTPTEKHKPDRILQKYRILHKVQDFTSPTGFYKSPAEVPSDTVTRNLKRVSHSPSVVGQPYRVPRLSHGISRRTPTPIEFGSSLSLLWQARPLGSASGARGVTYPLRTGGGENERAGLRYVVTPLSHSPLASFCPYPRIRGKNFCRFCIHPRKMLDFRRKMW